MGVVWLAQDEELEIPVALKFLPEEISRDAEAVASLKRETRRGLELSHPHIVKTYGFVKDDRSAAIAMEYVEGKTLSALKASREERPWFEVEEIAPWVLAICQALDYAHNRAKVIHRDLKPINVMLSAQGEIKITDFGVAQVLHDSYSRVSMTAASSGGTLIYMSPQQALGERPRVADDIYSLGAMIYDLLSGKAPFGGNPSTIYIQVRDRVPPPLAERREELSHAGAMIPPEWEQTVSACLAKETAYRPQSAMEVAERLGLAGGYRALIAAPEPLAEQPQAAAGATDNGAPVSTTVPAPELKTSVKPRRKWRRKLTAALIVLLAGGSLGRWWIGVEKLKLITEKKQQAVLAKAQRDRDHDAAKAQAARADPAVETKSLSNAKRIGFAFREYAVNNNGHFPHSLDELFPTYLDDRSILVSPFMPNEPIGYTYGPGYGPGLTDTSDPNAVLIEDKFAPLKGVRIVAHVDGSSQVLRAKGN